MGQALLDKLEVALSRNKWIGEILERFGEIALPDCWLVAGSVAQTIWNLGCGQPAELGLKDVDLIYFDDHDLSVDAEIIISHERRLRDLFRCLPIKLDVKNEARAHLWYEERFGYAIRPYLSSGQNATDGTLAGWPEPAETQASSRYHPLRSDH